MRSPLGSTDKCERDHDRPTYARTRVRIAPRRRTERLVSLVSPQIFDFLIFPSPTRTRACVLLTETVS